MPIFEYKCKKCGKKFEVLVTSQDEKIKCEHCGSSSIEKLFSSFAAKTNSALPECSGPACGSCCSNGACNL